MVRFNRGLSAGLLATTFCRPRPPPRRGVAGARRGEPSTEADRAACTARAREHEGRRRRAAYLSRFICSNRKQIEFGNPAPRANSRHTLHGTSGRRVAQQSVHGRATNVARVATPALAEATSLALCPRGAVARLVPAAEGSLSILLLLLLRLLRVQNGADARVVGVHAGQRAQDRRQEAGILEHG